MNRKKWVFFFLAIVLFVSLGYLSWPIERPVQWICHHFIEPHGLYLSVGKARWVPWGKLLLTDLKLTTVHGGKVYVMKTLLSLSFLSLIKGHLTTRWQLREIRLDPTSWGILGPLLKERISAEPLAAEGSAIVHIDWDQMTLEQFQLRGSLLQLQANGWLRRGSKTHLNIRGNLAPQLLEEMSLSKARDKNNGPRGTFQIQLDGSLSHPIISLTSNFF